MKRVKKKLIDILKILNSGGVRKEPVYVQKIFFVPLTRAYLCSNCSVVGASSKRCPRCESTALVNLSRFIPVCKQSIKLVTHRTHEIKNENTRSRSRLLN